MGLLTLHFAIGVLILLWWVVWTVIRCVRGLLALNMGNAIPEPNSWWFGELRLSGSWRRVMNHWRKSMKVAKEVGSAIAELGFHLLTGGGGGLMKAVGQAFLDKKRDMLDLNLPAGNLINILRAKELPELKKGKRSWQANADNGLGEIVIRTHLPLSGDKGSDPLSRNHINTLTADLVVVVPGGSGTLSELPSPTKIIMSFPELRSWLKSHKKN